MSDTYANFYREPSKPHQCMHHSEEDGVRCRATAMHNEMMCYHHRPDVILPIIENEPFLLENLDTRDDIQRALGQVGRQLACNRMDFQRAKLLIQVITAAMRNLPPHPRITDSANPNGLHEKRREQPEAPAQHREQHEVPVTVSEARSAQPKDPDAFHPVQAARTIPPPNPAESDTASHAATLSSSREASRTARSAAPRPSPMTTSSLRPKPAAAATASHSSPPNETPPEPSSPSTSAPPPTTSNR
jgi:hypothetical protein